MATEPKPMPQAVIDAILNHWVRPCACCAERERAARYVHRDTREECAHLDTRKAYQILREMRWAGDHYYYTFAGMYVGVELDGYEHT